MKRRSFLKITTAGTVPLILPKAVLKGMDLQLPSSSLESQFVTPPYSARPQGFWFWMNGNITKDGITRDLEAMDKAGFGGVLNMNVADGIPAGPVRYDSDTWHEMMKHSLKTLKEHNMMMVSYNCGGWSSGGGPWISPELSMKKIVWSELHIQGPNPAFKGKLSQPATLHDYYRDIAVLAFPMPKEEAAGTKNSGFRLENWRVKAGIENLLMQYSFPQPDTRVAGPDEVINSDQIVDLSSKMGGDGQLQWEMPEGQWTILRFGYTTTGKKPAQAPEGGIGLECDKLSSEATTYHWNQMVSRIMNDAGSLTGDTLISIEVDSFEAGPQNWTQGFGEEFERTHGYKLLRYLPCITGRVIDSVDKSERILWDFRRTIADLFTKNYYGTFADLCHKNKMKFSIEPYGPTGYFDRYSVAAQADIPMGEIWVDRYDAYHWASPKLASSAAHANGYQVVGNESFTAAFHSSGWENDPYSLKNIGDYMLLQGVNRLIFHNTVHHPWKGFTPGMTMGPHGIQMNRGNTWFKQSSAWLSYLGRSSFLLQQGQFVGDLCYYFGENVPNNPLRREEINPTPPEGYDYDSLATEFIMRLEVRDGKLTLPGGMQYRVLVFADFLHALRPEILQKIKGLVQAGATLVAPRPQRSSSLANYPQCDNQVLQIASEVWGGINGQNITENAFGKGRVYWGVPLEGILERLNVPPDFISKKTDAADISYIHRRIDGDDFYFVSNQSQRFVHTECIFRSTGVPEKWNPESTAIENIMLYRQENGTTTIPLFMAPAESLFVVFKNNGKRKNWIAEARLNQQDVLTPHTTRQNAFTLLEARYGIPNDPSKSVDVKEEISSRIRDGQLDIIPCKHINTSPAPGVARGSQTLLVKYRLDGKLQAKTVAYASRLVVPAQPSGLTLPSATIHSGKSGAIFLEAWKEGSYHLKTGDGKTKAIGINGVPAAIEIDGPWTVKFPPGWGAPPRIILERLASWTEYSNPDIRHFSGTATYEKTFNIQDSAINDQYRIYLDLGEVKNIAEVTLNGKELGIIWKPPFRIDVTNALNAGHNNLVVKITNLIPNRLIGDAGKPDPRAFKKHGNNGFAPDKWDEWLKIIKDEEQTGRYSKETGRYTFATWKRYDQNDPLLDSGLLGPVRLLTAVRQRIM